MMTDEELDAALFEFGRTDSATPKEWMDRYNALHVSSRFRHDLFLRAQVVILDAGNAAGLRKLCGLFPLVRTYFGSLYASTAGLVCKNEGTDTAVNRLLTMREAIPTLASDLQTEGRLKRAVQQRAGPEFLDMAGVSAGTVALLRSLKVFAIECPRLDTERSPVPGLPIELVEAVVRKLDASDVPAFAQTCRSLRRVCASNRIAAGSVTVERESDGSRLIMRAAR